MRRTVPAALVLTFLAPAGASGQALPTKAAVARIADSLAQDMLAGRGTPGLSIALVRGTDTLVMGGWGKANLEDDVAATAETVYRIGSVTKQFTAARVMQFVEQGNVKLDETIGTYLPALPMAWRGVTVRQLLNHTSGIPSYTDVGPRWQRRWGEEMPPDTIVALTAGDPMWFAPGTSWRYDNSGYVVLGILIGKISGVAWSDDFSERLAKPLGLTDTRWCDTKPVIPRRAQGYAVEGTSWINAPYLAMSQPYAAGSLCSTIRDLTRWNRALSGGKVVSAASYAMMTTPQGAASPQHYGFGLMEATAGSHKIITHGGSIHGFISANAWVPDVQLSITVLANAGSARTDALLQQLVRAALGVPLVQPQRRVTLSPADRAQYVGVYALQLPGGAQDFTFSERDGELVGQLAGQGGFPLTPYGNHVFGAAFDPSLRITFTVVSGRATGMVLVQGGQRFEGTRKP